MKRLLAAVLTLFLCASPAAQASDIDLLKMLYETRGQTVVSPLSLNLALSMAAEGARGETRAQLLQAAGMTEADLESVADTIARLGESGVKIANSAFIRKDFTVLESYLSLLQSRYQAERFSFGDEGILDQANGWVKEKTDGMIESLMDQEPDASLMLLLVNALALEAEWSVPFSPGSTSEATFHAPDGDVQKMFMQGTLSLPYAQVDGMTAVRLSYKDSQLGLTVILPDGGIGDALTALSENPVDWDSVFSEKTVTLSMPKLSAQDSVSLIDALKALGVTEAFGMSADLSGIDGQKDLYIGSVTQKTYLDIDENGTKAAASTGIGIFTKGALIEGIPFTVDRPYILLLTDGATGLTLFAAAIDEPQ